MRSEIVEMHMAERLSSANTFCYKLVLPSLWIGMFGLGTLLMFRGNQQAHIQEMRGTFAIAWLVGSAVILRTCGRLKRVELDGDRLTISNYIRQIVVPVSDIEDVRQNLFINIRPVSIQFRHDTPFGRRIVFMPKYSFRWFSKHEIVHRLRLLAGLH